LPNRTINFRRPVLRRPLREVTAEKKFPYEPITLGLYAISWAAALGPKIQAAATAGVDALLIPAKIYGAVIDHLFGEVEGEESQLWTYLLTAKPAGITEELHLAIGDLTECIGRISADLVEGIVGLVLTSKAAAIQATEVVKAVRTLIDDTLDHHEIEACIQAVLDAE
jgi:hypothetical protein